MVSSDFFLRQARNLLPCVIRTPWPDLLFLSSFLVQPSSVFPFRSSSFTTLHRYLNLHRNTFLTGPPTSSLDRDVPTSSPSTRQVAVGSFPFSFLATQAKEARFQDRAKPEIMGSAPVFQVSFSTSIKLEQEKARNESRNRAHGETRATEKLKKRLEFCSREGNGVRYSMN